MGAWPLRFIDNGTAGNLIHDVLYGAINTHRVHHWMQGAQLSVATGTGIFQPHNFNDGLLLLKERGQAVPAEAM